MSDISDKLRAKMIEKVRALLAKTTENGCSEEEALAAAAKAKELIDKHQLDVGAEETLAEGIEKIDVPLNGAYEALFWNVAWNGIETFTETKVWRSRFYRPGDRKRATGNRAVLYGLKVDAMFAGWLVDHLIRFTIEGARKHVYVGKMRREIKSEKDAWRAFVIGAATRISERLAELARKRREDAAASQARTGSTALVPIDKALVIQERLDEENIKLKDSKSSVTGAADLNAYKAGRTHGDKATFGRPVKGGSDAAQITA